MERLLFITGRPGIGKTTLILRVIEGLKKKGCTVGGMITNEMREGRRRVGFEITDLLSNRRGVLAHINRSSGPKVGKYRVNLRALSSIGARSIREALEKTDVVIIDEIGPMELNSEEFKSAVKEALNSAKPVVSTVHYRSSDSIIKEIGKNRDALIFEMDLENRSYLHGIILDKALLFIKRSGAK